VTGFKSSGPGFGVSSRLADPRIVVVICRTPSNRSARDNQNERTRKRSTMRVIVDGEEALLYITEKSVMFEKGGRCLDLLVLHLIGFV